MCHHRASAKFAAILGPRCFYPSFEHFTVCGKRFVWVTRAYANGSQRLNLGMKGVSSAGCALFNAA